jgi:CRP/FNR family transcriptional regulator
MTRMSDLRPIDCTACPIRHRAVCARCDAAELDQLAAIKTYRNFSAGAQIMQRGAPLEFVASVVTGVVSLSKTLEDGRIQTVGLLLASDFIGRPERVAIDFDVTATTDVVLCCFQRSNFKAMLDCTPHLSHRLLEMTLDELDAARDWMLLLGRKTARERLASFFELLALRAQPALAVGWTPRIELPLSREETANYLGLTLETVSRQLSQLKAQGILEFHDRRHFPVLDRAKLQAATGSEEKSYPTV